ncbi:TraI domain-containing protein (plasmid) [Vibrio sp. SS-MA-C1-2]|nr:TraI domain-containing protein [Vibrio sp. SS-MA-C1-2]
MGIEGNGETFEKMYMPVIARVIAYFHLLPASEFNHHRDVGGLLRHSLEVALMSLRACKFSRPVPIGLQDVERERLVRWQYASWLVGILHDAGKVIDDMIISDRDNEDCVWNPQTQTIFEWAVDNNIKRYVVTWKPNRMHKAHDNLSLFLLESILTPEVKAWLFTSDDNLSGPIANCLSNYKTQDGFLETSLRQADCYSSERDMKVQWHQAFGERKAAIEATITLAIRDLYKGSWRKYINKDKGRLFVVGERLYIDAEKGIGDIIRFVNKREPNRLPISPERVIRMMYDGGMLRHLHEHSLTSTLTFFKPSGAEFNVNVMQFMFEGVVFDGDIMPPNIPNCQLLLSEAGEVVSFDEVGQQISIEYPETCDDQARYKNVFEGDEVEGYRPFPQEGMSEIDKQSKRVSSAIDRANKALMERKQAAQSVVKIPNQTEQASPVTWKDFLDTDFGEPYRIKPAGKREFCNSYYDASLTLKLPSGDYSYSLGTAQTPFTYGETGEKADNTDDNVVSSAVEVADNQTTDDHSGQEDISQSSTTGNENRHPVKSPTPTIKKPVFKEIIEPEVPQPAVDENPKNSASVSAKVDSSKEPSSNLDAKETVPTVNTEPKPTAFTSRRKPAAKKPAKKAKENNGQPSTQNVKPSTTDEQAREPAVASQGTSPSTPPQSETNPDNQEESSKAKKADKKPVPFQVTKSGDDPKRRAARFSAGVQRQMNIVPSEKYHAFALMLANYFHSTQFKVTPKTLLVVESRADVVYVAKGFIKKVIRHFAASRNLTISEDNANVIMKKLENSRSNIKLQYYRVPKNIQGISDDYLGVNQSLMLMVSNLTSIPEVHILKLADKYTADGELFKALEGISEDKTVFLIPDFFQESVDRSGLLELFSTKTEVDS